jgi:hypothetical protein
LLRSAHLAYAAGLLTPASAGGPATAPGKVGDLDPARGASFDVGHDPDRPLRADERPEGGR